VLCCGEICGVLSWSCGTDDDAVPFENSIAPYPSLTRHLRLAHRHQPIQCIKKNESQHVQNDRMCKAKDKRQDTDRKTKTKKNKDKEEKQR
jgi:hypothetical protein